MVAIITYSDYPNGTPGAIRYSTFAQTLIDIGFSVVVFQKSMNVESCDRLQIKSFHSYNKYVRFFGFGLKVVLGLRAISKQETLQGVIVGADVPAIHAIAIKWWCGCNKIPCIFDATEWYSKEQFSNWKIAVPYWEREILNRFVIDRKTCVIAISSYLYDYFRNKGCKVTQIPIIYNKNAYNQLLRRDKKSDLLQIIYAGSHLKMDNIPLIIEALSVLPEEVRARIHFVIYGLSEEQIASSVSLEVLEKVKNSLSIKGRRSNNEVMSAYADADFSVVLRDPLLRVNRAGFPSKVVESMSHGVPVICNYSSDLRDYLTHNENSIVVNRLDVAELSEQLQILAYMPQSNREEIGERAHQTISEKLNSKLFEDNFRYIIS